VFGKCLYSHKFVSNLNCLSSVCQSDLVFILIQKCVVNDARVINLSRLLYSFIRDY